MEMNCCTNDRLLDLLDDNLNPVEKSEVEAHLAQCAACRKKLGGISAAHHFLRSELPVAGASIKPPEFLAMRIKHRLARAQAHQPAWWQGRQAMKWAAAAAVIVVAALLFSGKFSRPVKSPQPAPTIADSKAQNPKVTIVLSEPDPEVFPELPRRDRQQLNEGDYSDSQRLEEPLDKPNRSSPASPPARVQRPVLNVVKPVNYDQEM